MPPAGAKEGGSDYPNAWLQALFPDEPRELLPDRDSARARLGLPAEAPLFLFGGILRPYKGWDLLLAAFRRLRQEGGPDGGPQLRPP